MMMWWMKKVVVLVIMMADVVASQSPQHSWQQDAGGGVGAVLEAVSQPTCSLILLTTSPSTIFKEESVVRGSPWGVGVFEVVVDGQDANETLVLLSHLLHQARQVRMGSRCVRVVVVSHDPVFLDTFAEWSLKGRLLVWATKLLVVTSLPLPQLHALLSSHWTFSMMNTILLNLDDTPPNLRYSVYTHLPYSPDGAQVLRVAVWTPRHGLRLLTALPLFPEKFSNFHGAEVNVTGKPWPPYWVEEQQEAADGSLVTIYTGCDYLSLETISHTLNFTINIIPTASWGEAVKKVEERVAFITAVFHVPLPERKKKHDFTRIYEYNQMSFTLAKPGLKPSLDSLFYPLTGEVWAWVLVVLLFMPAIYYMVSRGREKQCGRLRVAAEVLEVMGILVGQNLPQQLPPITSGRLLVVAWLVFALIIGTVYRGNLTAALTLPKYPPRPETVEQLVDTVHKVTMPPFGELWRQFFAGSDSEVYKKLARMMMIGPSTREGLQMAIEQNTANMAARRYLSNMIVEHFTEADGTTRLYLARETLFPGQSAWPIPHDAPYQSQLDRCLIAIIEAGLYEKWSDDTVSQTRRRSQRRQREYLAQQLQQGQQVVDETAESDKSIIALTVTHMQGPLVFILLGLFLAGVVFAVEVSMTYNK
ncbi:ionotropic receptor 93a-like isoform X2 [Homarus americanus]|uniref:ionotropic receptor 93a-like isoform X2 n=1 Tax=Homarus americanus TaxID=6706 RepID=UPI001C46CE29|nr:ionotropic receptor 93a-like isoform X2 [Homarus americanus]